MEAGKNLNYTVSEKDQKQVREAADKLLDWGVTQREKLGRDVEVNNFAANAMTRLCSAFFRPVVQKADFPGASVSGILIRRFAIAEDGKSLSFRETNIQEFAVQDITHTIRPSRPGEFEYSEGTLPVDMDLSLHQLHLDAEKRWFEGHGDGIGMIGTFWEGRPGANLGTVYYQPRDVKAWYYPYGKTGIGRPSVFIPEDHVARGMESTEQVTRRGQVIAGHYYPHHARTFRDIFDELTRTGVPARYFVGCTYHVHGDTRYVQLHSKGKEQTFKHLYSLRSGDRKWQYTH